MSPELIVAIIVASIGLLAAPMGQLVGWFLNRKKNTADVSAVITDSSLAAVEAMQTTMATLRVELEAAINKIQELQKEVIELKEQNITLIHENAVLNRKIEEFTRIINDASAMQTIVQDNTGELPVQ